MTIAWTRLPFYYVSTATYYGGWSTVALSPKGEILESWSYYKTEEEALRGHQTMVWLWATGRISLPPNSVIIWEEEDDFCEIPKTKTASPPWKLRNNW
jgi:hypothetical protein